MLCIQFDKGKILSGILFCISIGIISYCLFIYLRTASYVMPAADDFDVSYNIEQGLLRGEGYAQMGFECMIDMYLNWQGTFSSHFLVYFLAPYVRLGIDGIKLFCALSILLFYGSLWGITSCIMKYLFKVEKNSVTLFVCALITWMASNAVMPDEVFFWYNGICLYTLPLVSMLFGLRSLIKYVFVKARKRDLLCASILGFLTCGGTLQCAAGVCFVYLLVTVWSFLLHSQERWKTGVVFAITLSGALLNTLAPGNFARQNAINDAGLPLFSALGYSLQNVLLELKRLPLETDFIFVLITMVFIGVYLCYKKATRIRIRPWTVLLISGGGIFTRVGFRISCCVRIFQRSNGAQRILCY